MVIQEIYQEIYQMHQEIYQANDYTAENYQIEKIQRQNTLAHFLPPHFIQSDHSKAMIISKKRF